MLRAGRLGVVCAALLLNAGCFHTLGGSESGPTIETLGKVHQGVTTPAELVAMFGPPTRTLRPGPDRQVLIYDYADRAGGREVTRYTYEFVDGVLDRRSIGRVAPGDPTGAVVAPGADAL